VVCCYQAAGEFFPHSDLAIILLLPGLGRTPFFDVPILSWTSSSDHDARAISAAFPAAPLAGFALSSKSHGSQQSPALVATFSCKHTVA
jgi:hypothetical protein